MKKVFLLSKFDISDTSVYLAQILKQFGKEVIVVDETEEEYIKYFVNAEEEAQNIFEHQGINYFFSEADISKNENIDIVIINTNKEKILPTINIEDEVFIFVNQDRRELLGTKSLLEALAVKGHKNVTRISKLIDSKIEIEYISNFLETENINVIEDHEIYFDESNLRTKVENTFNLKLKFKDVSKEYKNVLFEMGSVILALEIDDKKVIKRYRKAIKIAERGGKSAGMFSKQ